MDTPEKRALRLARKFKDPKALGEMLFQAAESTREDVDGRAWGAFDQQRIGEVLQVIGVDVKAVMKAWTNAYMDRNTG